MSRTRSNLYTARQTSNIMVAWGCTSPLPTRGSKILITWPGKGELDVDMAEIEPTQLKGTYGDKLFRVTESSRAGRAFEAVVQEAHVLACVAHRNEQRRLQNLARYEAFNQSIGERHA